MAKALSRKVTIYINGKEVENTINSLTSEMIKLKAQQRGMIIGSEEYINTSLKMKEIESVLKAQKAAIQSLGEDWENTRKAVADYSTILYGLKVATGKISDAYNWAKGYVEEAAKMDDVYADVMKTTGLTHDEVMKLNETFKQMDTRTSREQLNQLAYEAGKLGINSAEAVAQFVSAADKINIALGDVLGDGAMVTIGKLTEIFESSTKALEGKNLEEKMLAIGSAVNSLGQASTANEGYMVDFMKRLGGIAAQAGLSADQILGFASALDQNGQAVEMSATAFTKMIMQMVKKPEEFVKAAGVSIDEFKRMMDEDMNGTILRVLEGMDSQGGFQQIVQMFNEMGLDGSRAAQAISSLAKHLDQVREAQALASQEIATGSSVVNEFNTKNNTLQAQLEKAKDRFHDTAETLGNALYPAIIGVTNAGSRLMKGLEGTISLLTRYPELLSPLIALGGAWLAMKAKTVAVMAAQWVKQTALNVATRIQTSLTQRKVMIEQRELEVYHKKRIAEYQDLINKEKLILADRSYMYTEAGLARIEQAEANIKAYSNSVTQHAEAADKAHTAAIRAKGAAMKATPWGLLLTAAVTAITLITQLTKKESEAAATAKEAAKQFGEEEAKLKQLKNKLESAAVGSEEYKKALDELRRQHPDIMQKYSDEYLAVNGLKGVYNELTKAVRQSVYERVYSDKMSQLKGDLAEDLADMLGTISNIIDRNFKNISEQERQKMKQSINTNLRLFTEGAQEYKTTADNIKNIITDNGGSLGGNLYMGRIWSQLNKLDSKIKETNNSLNDLKTDMDFEVEDPFGVEKMNLEQLNAELTKSLNLQRSYQRAVDSGRDGYAERLDNETRKVEALRKQIAKLEAQKGNADGGGDIGNYTTGETEKERKEREKREAREAKRIADAWKKAQDDARKMTDKFNLQAESGLQKVKDDVDSKTEEMIARLRETAEEARESADDLEKNLKAAAENYKESQVKEYLEKVTAEVDRLKKATAKSEDGERLNKVSQAVENLRQQLNSVDVLIVKLRADLGKADEGSDTYNQLQAEIKRLEAIKKDAVSAAFSSLDFKVENPFEEQSQFSLKDNQARVIEEVKKKVEEYAKALGDAEAAYRKMAETARAEGNDDKAKEYEAQADALKKQSDNIDSISEKAEELARRNALKETINAWCDGIQQFADQALSIFSNINQLLDNIADSELQKMEDQKDAAIDDLDEQLEQGLISQEEYEESKESLEDEYTKKENETKLEQWRRQKALDLTQAIIGGALAAVRAYAEGGPYAGPFLAAMVAAATGIQIAAIESQPEPYAKGGYVPKRTVYQAGEAGPEWVASNQLLSDPATAPIIEALESYQRGNRRALADIPMAQINMPVATAAARELGRRRSIAESGIASAVDSINPNISVTIPQNGEMMKLWQDLATYLKDPKNRQAVISRQTMTDFERNEQFLRNIARL